MKPKTAQKVTILVVGVVILMLAFGAMFLANQSGLIKPPDISTTDLSLKQFSSDQEFRAYIQQGSSLAQIGLDRSSEVTVGVPESSSALSNADRYSQTNVQVAGIDEPDIVKTDGKKIYLSNEFRNYWGREIDSAVSILEPAFPPQPQSPATDIINAFPPSSLAKEGTITEGGGMLLSDSTLIILGSDTINAYNVADPANPKKVWNIELEKNFVTTSRLKNGKLYLITQTSLHTANPCPIPLFKGSIGSVVIPCTEIYHPISPITANSTITASEIDIATGKVDKNTTLVASSGNSIVYMSQNSLYISYSYPGDYLGYMYRFFQEKANDLIPSEQLQKIQKLNSYDISFSSKLNEFQLVMESYKNTLSDDQRLRFETELTNRMKDYSKAHSRELETTGIAKIDLANLTVSATGGVPGHPLNQFSLDEYQDHLRIATTTSGGLWGLVGGAESTNDLYILDSQLTQVSSILDLGLGERVYSARFIADKGYLVTFKQIDPFYVFDLADPKNPRKSGELKIPGFSSYLHPLGDNKILGVGQENGQVKLSLFDVADPANPTEVSKYLLDDYYSEVSNNHHAFLQDSKHGVFFIPGGKGGYIFSYQNNGLSLKAAISGSGVRRSVYMNDYMYVISDDKVTVLNEADWQEVNSLSL